MKLRAPAIAVSVLLSLTYSRVVARGNDRTVGSRRGPAHVPQVRVPGRPIDVILCRPAEGASDKQLRFEKLTRGTASAELPPLEIVMWLGDNIHDFPGLSQELRDDGGDWSADFGTRLFLFPNPMYGSWMENPRR